MTTANPAIQALADSPVRRHQGGTEPTTAPCEPTNPASAASPTDDIEDLFEGGPVYDTLEALVKAEPVGAKGKRPYRVEAGKGRTFYVFTNSAANAALEVCEVSAITQKEMLAALAAAVKAK